MEPEEFRRVGHRLIDWIADYRTRIDEFPVQARVPPGALRAQLPPSAPETGEPLDTIFADLERIIVPGLSHWQGPRFFGYFPANADLASVLGDYISTGLGQLGLNWQASPALTELEEQMTEWMRQLVGLSDGWSGVIQDTASTSTLVALICARERSSGYSINRGGLQAQPQPLVVYASTQSHSSVEKAALLAGFGRENVRAIVTDAHHAMRADALAEAVVTDIERGRRPCAIVATTGTTATTALDPLEPLAELAAAYGLWLHVDGAMAGSAMIVPEYRWMWQGIERADSLVFNPHKWLGAAFDCSLYYVRAPEHLINVMSSNPSYLQTSADSTVKNLRDWGIPLGRRMRAMKLWTLLRAHGAEALRQRIRRDVQNAHWLAQQVDKSSGWVRLAPVPLQTVCMRYEPDGLSGEELDRFTLGWAGRVNASGAAYLTPAMLDQRWMVRVSIGAIPTEREHVMQLWQTIRAEAEAL
jgi:aromatic-L-amino-acid decarboxylase